MKTYHLVPEGDGWTLTEEGKELPIEGYPDHTKEESLALAIEVISTSQEPVSLRIHNQDGTIAEERTYPREADPAEYEG